MRNKALSITLAVIVAIFTGFYFLRNSKDDTVKIGAILTITGPAADAGVDIQNGLSLAVDMLNARSGVNGKKLELIIEDSKTDPEAGKTAFEKIEQHHRPIFYIVATSLVATAVAPLAEESQVVMIGVATAPNLTSNKKWIFKYYTTPPTEVSPILALLERLKSQTLGILYLNDEYGSPVDSLLRAGFQKSGGTVIDDAFEVQQTDFKAEIEKIQNTDAAYIIGYDSHIKNIIKQLKDTGYRGNILTSNTLDWILTANDAAELDGVYFAASIIYNPNFAFARTARDKYQEKYVKPFNHLAATGYDIIKLIGSLLEDQEISRENLRRLLEGGFIYPGVFGDIHVKPSEHNMTFPLYPARISDGKIEYLW